LNERGGKFTVTQVVLFGKSGEKQVFRSTFQVADRDVTRFTPNRFASLGVIHIQSFGLSPFCRYYHYHSCRKFTVTQVVL